MSASRARFADVARGDGGLRRDRSAPFATYCSICAWTVRMRAWISTPSGVSSGKFLDGRLQVRIRGGEPVDAQAALSLDDGADGPVLELDHLGDLGERPDRVQLGRVLDVLLIRLSLGHEGDGSAIGDGGIERVDALLPTDLERDDHLRER